MLDTIRAKRGELYRIADRNKADKLYVFGSCARQEETEDSDVDFLVRFRKDASLLDQVGIANEFRDFLGRQVDVVSHDINELALQIKPIYDALPPVEPLPDIVDLL